MIGLWITDSDDAVMELRLLPVTYQANWINDTLYELKWRITEESALYPGWLIEGVQALKPRNASFLRVRKAGTGTGRVLSDPAGIDCGDACVKPYAAGTQVSLVAIPEDGSNFVGWQGACSGTGDCGVTVDGERHVMAVFEAIPQMPETFSITMQVEPGATVSPAGDTHEVPAGADAVFVFSPDPGYLVLDVLVDGQSVGAVTAYTLTNVSADHSITVKTVARDAQLAIVHKKCLDEEGNEKACEPGKNALIIVGDQECDSECMRIVVPFEQGSALMLKVILDDKTSFEGWEVDGEIISDEDKLLYILEDSISPSVTNVNSASKNASALGLL